MGTRRALERRLSFVDGFEAPSPALEQYPTPAEIAASLIHVADLNGDLDRPVLDLGAGTGMLAIAAAARTDEPVVGIEVDRDALATARRNASSFDDLASLSFVRGDIRSLPVACQCAVTVLSNPPFGAQDGNEGADKAFLDSARSVAAVSYSIHNAGSRSFIESYAGDHGGSVTDAFDLDLDLDRQFSFHDQARQTIDAEAYRIDWGAGE